MPLTEKGQKIERKLESEYGAKKGKSVLYALKAEGKVSGVDNGRPAGSVVSTGATERSRSTAAGWNPPGQPDVLRGSFVPGGERRR